MQTVELKLKQASAVLGVSPKDLQNLVQLKVIRPPRRGGIYWFDYALLLQAKVAFHLKKSLGSSSDLLSRFVEALGSYVGKVEPRKLTDITLCSRATLDHDPVEVKIPLRSLAQELDKGIPRGAEFNDLPRGRRRPGWKEEFLSAMQQAAADLGDISEEEIIRTIEQYRAEVRQKKLQALQKLGKAGPSSALVKLPEITIIARSKKKTA